MQRFIGERWVGYSTETKPTNDIISGSRFDELDTLQTYIFNGPSNGWIQIGGGGGSAEATGQALISYINSASGILNNKINSSGSYLYGLISAASAGVGSINGSSGALTLNGAGSSSVITNGQTITISGNSPVSSGFNFRYISGGNQTHLQIGDLSGNYYSLRVVDYMGQKLLSIDY